MIPGIITKMIDCSKGTVHDTEHFMKVWGYARTIGQLEGLEAPALLVLEAAAVTHDIACPLCREKYGSAPGHLQEKEGPGLVIPLLQHTGLTDEQIRRVAFLVGHHHTYEPLGKDHRILLEADYLVNAAEGGYSPENLQSARESIFRTAAGTRLLKSIFSLAE